MLGDLLSTYEGVEYRLILTTPSRIPIGEIEYKKGFEFNNVFSNSQSSISFSTDKTVNGEEVDSYENIIKKNLILLKKNEVNVGYFIIDDVQEDIGYENSSKTIVALSQEYVLLQKKVHSIDGTYTIQQLFDITVADKAKSWTVGYVSSTLATVSRTFDISEATLLDLLYNYVQKSFDCVVRFNTLNKEILFYDKDEFSTASQLFLSFDNFQKSISKNTLSSDIITRLYIYGKDELKINAVNPTGKPYRDNFDYFKQFMSSGLLASLNAYETLVASNEGTFEGYLLSINTYNQQLVGTGDIYVELADSGASSSIVLGANASTEDDYYNGSEIFITDGTGYGQKRVISDYVGSTKTATVSVAWTTVPDSTSVVYIRELIGKNYEINYLTFELSEIQIAKDAKIIRGIEYSAENSLETSKIAEIEAKQAEIDAVNANIASVVSDINDLLVLLSEENNFTESELIELDDYIIEDTYKDDGFYASESLMTIEEQYAIKSDLMATGDAVLANMSTPRFTTKLNIGDILTIFEYQHQRDLLQLGAVITVEYADGVTLNARIVEMMHSIDDQRLDIVVSNAYKIDDYTFSFINNLQSISTSANNNSFERDKYNYYLKNDYTRVNNFIDSSIDVSNNSIISAFGEQEVTIDERGIWLRSKDDLDPTGYNPYQLRLLSNVIVFSKDYFQTSQLAITASGINGVSIEDGTLNISSFFVAPEGVVKGFIVDHLRTTDSDNDVETTNYMEIVDKRFSVITGQKLYWTDGTYTTKTLTSTAFETRMIQNKSLLEEPLYIQVKSENPEDDMTTTPNNYPVWLHSKLVDNPLYYIDETTGTTSITPTLVTITTPDFFTDEDYYLPVVTQYEIGGQPAYWTVEPTLSNVRTDFPSMVHQYGRYEKFKIGFEGTGNSAYPIQVFGVGTDTDPDTPNGQGFIYKDADGFNLEYYSDIGDSRKIQINDDALVQVGNVGEDGLRNIRISTTAPTSPQTGDLWINPDDPILEELTQLDFYSDGFIAEYNGDTVTYTWTLDGSGYITELYHVETGTTVTVTWNATPMP